MSARMASDNAVSRPRTVRARKRWTCWSCRQAIVVGAEYVRRVVFPNMETNQGPAPVVYRAHVDCGRWS